MVYHNHRESLFCAGDLTAHGGGVERQTESGILVEEVQEIVSILEEVRQLEST